MTVNRRYWMISPKTITLVLNSTDISSPATVEPSQPRAENNLLSNTFRLTFNYNACLVNPAWFTSRYWNKL